MSEDILSPSKNNQTSDQDKLEDFWKEGVLLVLEYYFFLIINRNVHTVALH